MVSNDKSVANEKCDIEDRVKKIKWKSLKKLMKNQNNRVKWSQKPCQTEGEKKTQNSRQSNLKISKKATSSAESPVTSMMRPTRKRKTIERYSSLRTSASRASCKPFPIVKGKGTRLKDIPKVACKLSQSKHDENKPADTSHHSFWEEN
ncbi:hypothetical protein POM88_038848 [Heracleum sosnowskyi]|uniref:Uncharacterized protein n=1 Tax=Heracleum sosnowskyi TaxID=360622 RepID=A0AAD8M8E4_9APIA|nr:hypothetical protein POM88_038848 [Heracleum sosnowskyi]